MGTGGKALIGVGVGLLVMGLVFHLFRGSDQMMGEVPEDDWRARFFGERVKISIRWALPLLWIGALAIIVGVILTTLSR